MSKWTEKREREVQEWLEKLDPRWSGMVPHTWVRNHLSAALAEIKRFRKLVATLEKEYLTLYERIEGVLKHD